MRQWQTPAFIRYWAHKRIAAEDTAVPPRPTAEHEWVDGAGWALPANVDDRRASEALDKQDRVVFEVLWRHENRIRVLEGANAVTRMQFRGALITIWKELFGGA